MDLRAFVLICLAAASRHQHSPASLEVEARVAEIQKDTWNETDFQPLRDAANSSDWKKTFDTVSLEMFQSFVKTHPEEGWSLFRKMATDEEADFRVGAALFPAWPMLLETHNAEAWQLFKELAKDKNEDVRKAAAHSPAWPMILKTHDAEARHLFEELAKDQDKEVRMYLAASPAWPMLLETHNAEAWRLFKELAKDEAKKVRMGTLFCPAWRVLLETHNAEGWQLVNEIATDAGAFWSYVWPGLIESNLSQSWQLFAKLMSDQVLQGPGNNTEFLADMPAWKAFGKVPPTAVAELRDSQKLQTARSLQKVADDGLSHEVKGLPLFDGLSTQLQRSTNETWLGEMIKLPLFMGSAAQRLVELVKEREQEAIKAREEAEAATAKVMILLVIVLLLAVLCIVLFLLWYFYPTIRQWQDEKKLAEEAKQAIRAAEVFEMVISVTPEPPAHMAIFDNYQRIYANPYILYKYGYLKEALTQAFRISAEALDVGLNEWDFSAVQKDSTNAVQEMASKSYGMARTFIDKNQPRDLVVLMQLCDQIQNDCSPYVSKIEEADMTAVDKCFSMYEQAFLAKRAYFDPLLERIGGKTGAEANLCGEKGILRLAEKNCLRPSGGLIWDCVRAMCVGHDVSELIEVMKCLKDEHDAKRLRIIHVNNRFKRPTSDNWQDIAVYVMFTDPRFSDVVAEIQLTHETFVAVRTKFRAHDAYDHIRFAAEALKLRDKVIVRGVPDSVTKRPEQ